MIRQEQHPGRRHPGRLRDRPIGCGRSLGTDPRVEKPVEQGRQVALVRIAEDQLLRLFRSRRIDEKPQAAFAPALQHRRRIRIDRSLQHTRFIALPPDHALQQFQRPGLAVLVDPGQQQRHRFVIRGARHAAQIPRFRQHTDDFRLVAMRGNKRRQPFPRIGEQHLMHEDDGCRRPFDIGDDGTNPVHAAAPSNFGKRVAMSSPVK